MKTAALVSGFRRFKGSTIVALGYRRALERMGYEVRWYQCVEGKDPSQFLHGARDIVGVTTGAAALDQGLNLRIFFPRRIGTLSEDLVVLTDQLLSPMLRHNPRALVVTHDLRELDPRTRTNALSPRLARYALRKLPRARGVLIDSEATRRDLERRVHDLPPRAVVAPCVQASGDASTHLRRSLDRLGQQRKLQLLYVAVDRPYKNLGTFIELARYLGPTRKGVAFQFVLVSELRSSTQRDLSDHPVPHLRVIPSVEDMKEVYESTDVLIFPSSFEGFGLPVAEAMAFGIPVVASSAEAVVEVVGGGGICVPDQDVAKWAGAVNTLLDPSEYERWSLRASERAGYYSESAFQDRLGKVLTAWG